MPELAIAQPDSPQLPCILYTIAASMNGTGGSVSTDTISAIAGCSSGLEGVLETQEAITQYLRGIVSKYIGSEYVSLINIRFTTAENQLTAIINVAPASKPVFLKESQGQTFYILQGQTPHSLSSDALQKYIQTHFGN